ncbi:hypothetical protein AB0P17_15505 [Streptomyces sp. NPDC088124]|uniref:hypothetical protein n=1 Tax=Streptomyces sp. NPDC088124 TaxID=3154654 RepID=UPI003420092A
MPKKLEHVATAKHLTLDELAAFVADAYASGATGTEPVSATVGFSAKLRTVHLIVPADPIGTPDSPSTESA